MCMVVLYNAPGYRRVTVTPGGNRRSVILATTQAGRVVLEWTDTTGISQHTTRISQRTTNRSHR
jgi:hypothetical protein